MEQQDKAWHSATWQIRAQHSTAQNSTAQHSVAQRGTARNQLEFVVQAAFLFLHTHLLHSTAQHSTAQHSTAHSTAQHSTTQRYLWLSFHWSLNDISIPNVLSVHRQVSALSVIELDIHKAIPLPDRQARVSPTACDGLWSSVHGHIPSSQGG